MEPPWDGGTKSCSNGPGHMTKMTTMPIYGKNLLLQNRMTDDLENWYTALSTKTGELGTRVLPNLFRLCLWVDLDLFYGTVKFAGPLCFCMGKKLKQ